MGLTARDKGGGDFEPISEGMHHAVCWGIFDIGTQHNDNFNKDAHKVVVYWELPNERLTLEVDGVEKDVPARKCNVYTNRKRN